MATRRIQENLIDVPRLMPSTVIATTNETGLATVQLKIPGTFGQMVDSGATDYLNAFNGYNDPRGQGRYFKSVTIWPDVADARDGDRIYGTEIKDLDGVIPLGMRAQFPLYPIIHKFYDQEMQETATVKTGLQIRPGTLLELGSLSSTLIFIPSGLYLVASFQSGANLSGIKVRANFHWAILSKLG